MRVIALGRYLSSSEVLLILVVHYELFYLFG